MTLVGARWRTRVVAAAVMATAMALVSVGVPASDAQASPAAPGRTILTSPAGVAGLSSPSQAEPEPPAPTSDPKLQADLDAVVALSPPDSCLSVSIGDGPTYRHRADAPLIPASTEKLFTAQVALDLIGADTRFETRVVAPSAPVAGVVVGDLTMVGGGDPTLVTDTYRFARRIGADQPVTSLEALADQVAAAGITRVTGRIVGDETRYDQARTGPTWPERYATQNQSGPISALEVDDGYQLVVPPPGQSGPVVRNRAADPATNAARLLTERLLLRGIQVDGAFTPVSGAAPSGAVDVASVSSSPLRDIVRHMLLFSDNQIAEMLTKEIGRVSGGGGSTVAGADLIDSRTVELDVVRTGADAVDGSGLDRANRATCDALVSVLDESGGLAGPLGQSLPVAGRSGSLAGRFRAAPAEGVLYAKTGSLSDVTALAGFVELSEGGTATFAYIANGKPVDAGLLGLQDLLGTALATYLPPCPESEAAGLVAPLAPYAAGVGVLAMFPLQSVLLPGAVLPLHVFEERYRALVDRCLALEEDFGVALISRGSEVGGHDVRTDVGTRARIVEARQVPDGRWAVLAVGIGRIRIDDWLPDDPYPLAEVEDWPDPLAATGLPEAIAASTARLRRVLSLRAELGEIRPDATVDLSVDLSVVDPSLASFRLVALSPLGDLDRQRLLAAPDIADRLLRLDALLDEDEDECRARLSGA